MGLYGWLRGQSSLHFYCTSIQGRLWNAWCSLCQPASSRRWACENSIHRDSCYTEIISPLVCGGAKWGVEFVIGTVNIVYLLHCHGCPDWISSLGCLSGYFWITQEFESVTSVKYMDTPVWTETAESLENLKRQRKRDHLPLTGAGHQSTMHGALLF